MNSQQTSLFAYKTEVLPNLANTQREVFTAIEDLGEATDKEIAVHLGWDRSSVNGRRNELVTKGLVVEANQRPCKHTGRIAIAWRISGVVI